MTLAKAAVSIFASASIAPGGTKASPSSGGTGGTVSVAADYRGDIGYSITNGGTAPSAAGTITFQTSPDGVKWYDYATVSGSLIAGDVQTNTLFLDDGIMNLRALCYGNTGQSVAFEASLQGVTGQ